MARNTASKVVMATISTAKHRPCQPSPQSHFISATYLSGARRQRRNCWPGWTVGPHDKKRYNFPSNLSILPIGPKYPGIGMGGSWPIRKSRVRYVIVEQGCSNRFPSSEKVSETKSPVPARACHGRGTTARGCTRRLADATSARGARTIPNRLELVCFFNFATLDLNVVSIKTCFA